MEVTIQLLIALIAIGLATSSHYFCLHRLKTWMNNTRLSPFLTLLGLVYGITLSQLIAAMWFAISFKVSISIGLGALGGEVPITFIETFYFSIINLTTLGMSPVEPLGHLYLLAGLEAMTGFLLVSCSASLIFKTMNKQ
ncbi:MAG: transporter [Rheinheimera sp.]|uniref:ion channel n=1 Tax=Arsukibacterium sp. UBA3155 TaxID=1946058 RepID=UPI000C944231|nr:ion channel [Arsukibacterium sp. UBA3155]MAD73729.1 transporter [Rheinheimera sp.]|tara:strand:- start:9236 stop:9652 length:417 start_codon:yes stop_codon:yes gene_type:complete